jgi:hypothetical protein
MFARRELKFASYTLKIERVIFNSLRLVVCMLSRSPMFRLFYVTNGLYFFSCAMVVDGP